MRNVLLAVTIGLIVAGQDCGASDFPMEPIILRDGVLLIDKATGQNWILETGPHRPPDAPYVWKLLPLPGAARAVSPMSRPPMAGSPMSGDPNGQLTPGTPGMLPPHMSPVPPQFAPGMAPPFWHAPHPGFIPPGSYSQAVPSHIPPRAKTEPPIQTPAELKPRQDKVEPHLPAKIHGGDDVEKMDTPKGKSNEQKPEEKPKSKKPKDKNKK